jgi:hypothetical protein
MCSRNRGTHIALAGNARLPKIAIFHFLHKLVYLVALHQTDRTAPEAAAHHPRTVAASNRGGNIHHCIQFSTTHLIIVAKTDVRFLHQLA